MSKRIEGMQDAGLELGMPELTPELQEYIDRHPWPHIKSMREFVAKQLVKPVMIREDERPTSEGTDSL